MTCQDLQSDLFGVCKWPLQGLSDSPCPECHPNPPQPKPRALDLRRAEARSKRIHGGHTRSWGTSPMHLGSRSREPGDRFRCTSPTEIDLVKPCLKRTCLRGVPWDSTQGFYNLLQSKVDEMSLKHMLPHCCSKGLWKMLLNTSRFSALPMLVHTSIAFQQHTSGMKL